MISRFLACISGRVELPVTKMRKTLGRGRYGGKIGQDQASLRQPSGT